MTTRQHWQQVYQSKAATEVSWYAEHLGESLRMIREAAALADRIVDVGGGASTLVDDLLELGYRDLTVLDVSPAALALSRKRLGERAARVKWLEADVTRADLGQNSFDLWHDRAVFHFLTAEPDRRAYMRRLERSLAPGGHVVIATFALAGPNRCSGLEVVRYAAEALARELGPAFELSAQRESTHTTPAGKPQRFLCCRFHKRL